MGEGHSLGALVDRSANLKAVRLLCKLTKTRLVRPEHLGLDKEASDQQVVECANQHCLVLLTADRGKDMSKALEAAVNGVVRFQIPDFGFRKIRKHYEWLARHLPQSRTGCQVLGLVLRVTTHECEVSDRKGIVEVIEFPEATRLPRRS